MRTSTSPSARSCILWISVGKPNDFTKGIFFTRSANVVKINFGDGKSATSKSIFNFGTLTENATSGKLEIAQSMQFDPALPGGLFSSIFNSNGVVL